MGRLSPPCFRTWPEGTSRPSSFHPPTINGTLAREEHILCPTPVSGFGASGVAVGLAQGCVPMEFTQHVSLQLDPQAVQTKNWHMDVIEMNGVSGATGTQPLAVIAAPSLGLCHPFI